MDRAVTVPAVVIVAAAVDDAQVTLAVKLADVPSLNLPVATNWRVLPKGTVGAVGVTAIAVNVGVPTVKVVDPEVDPSVL